MKNAAMKLAMLEAFKVQGNTVTRKKTRAELASNTSKPEHYTLTVHNYGFTAYTKNKTWKKPRVMLGNKEWK